MPECRRGAGLGRPTQSGARRVRRLVCGVFLGVAWRRGVGRSGRGGLGGTRRYDIEGAAAEGIASIGVLWGYGSREELAAAGAGQIVGTIPELRALLL